MPEAGCHPSGFSCWVVPRWKNPTDPQVDVVLDVEDLADRRDCLLGHPLHEIVRGEIGSTVDAAAVAATVTAAVAVAAAVAAIPGNGGQGRFLVEHRLGQGVVHDRYATHVEDVRQHEAKAIAASGRKHRHGLLEKIGKMLHQRQVFLLGPFHEGGSHAENYSDHCRCRCRSCSGGYFRSRSIESNRSRIRTDIVVLCPPSTDPKTHRWNLFMSCQVANNCNGWW
jgi:hypothetical protein